MTNDDVQKSVAGAAKKARKSARRVKAHVSPTELNGPSPNAATNLAMADIALRGGSALARRAVERAFLGTNYSSRKTMKILKGRSVTEKLLHTALARLALGSVPGAIVIGGALVAKTLYDRSKPKEAAREGDAALDDMASDGEGT